MHLHAKPWTGRATPRARMRGLLDSGRDDFGRLHREKSQLIEAADQSAHREERLP
ncbi:hypothetical protein ACFC18_42345 [Streptomyces sp. NPDC056121]|uniref:hypothetical protein n=1 Tax=Streptomyces sp. NPDC056121 TaxID=3345718 RepID=UPI0035D6F536